jgi:hypothetical protein
MLINKFSPGSSVRSSYFNKIISNNGVNFLSQNSTLKSPFRISKNYGVPNLKKNFSSPSQSFKKVSPEEIRNTIRLMRINNSNMNFSQYDKYLQWSTPKEAMDVFKEYIEYFSGQHKLDYFQNNGIFDDIKLLLKHVEADPESDKYFYLELINILRKLYIENFKQKEFFTNNIHYCLRCFVFMKNLLEFEYLVKHTDFMKEFYCIIEECARNYIDKLYLDDLSTFTKSAGTMEEFLSRFISFCDSKYIIAYNQKFYKFENKFLTEKILTNFENLILHLVMNDKPELISDMMKELANLIYKHSLLNERIIDYLNIFLVKHKNYFNIFYLIDMLFYLTSFKQCTNYELLNYFYLSLEKSIESKHMINFPKDYFIKCFKIISQNQILGGFVLMEKINQLLIEKSPDDLNVNEIISILIAMLKSNCNDPILIEYYLNLILKGKMFDNMRYRLCLSIKTLFDRFITEEFFSSSSEIFEEFYKYTLKKINLKLDEVKIFKNAEYDNESFVLFIKNELTIAKTDFLEEVITQEDFHKYYNSLKWINLQCLFKIYKNFEFKNMGLIEFINEEENMNSFKNSETGNKNLIVNFYE